MTTWDTRFRGHPGIGLINAGDDLAAIIVHVADADDFAFADHDVLVVAQKIVSKAEHRIIALATVAPRRTGPSGWLSGLAAIRACASSTWTSPEPSSTSRAATWSLSTTADFRAPEQGLPCVQRRPSP